MTDKPRPNPLPFIALALVALIAGVVVSKLQSVPAPAPAISATVLPKPRPLPNITLIDNKGRPLTPTSLKGKWTLVFFGYTNCPDVCPAALTVLQQAAQLMEKPPAVAGKVRVLFVSVDPERDTPKVLDQYVRYFHKSFVGATGTHEALTKLTRTIGVVYVIGKKNAQGRYSVDHSAQILLLDPQARLYAVYTGPHSATRIAADMRKLVMAKQ